MKLMRYLTPSMANGMPFQMAGNGCFGTCIALMQLGIAVMVGLVAGEKERRKIEAQFAVLWRFDGEKRLKLLTSRFGLWNIIASRFGLWNIIALIFTGKSKETNGSTIDGSPALRRCKEMLGDWNLGKNRRYPFIILSTMNNDSFALLFSSLTSALHSPPFPHRSRSFLSALLIEIP